MILSCVSGTLHTQEKNEAEMDHLVKQGVLEAVQFPERKSPVVPVVMKNGSIQLCEDFKQRVNHAAKFGIYPLPRIEDLFASLNGETIFSKLEPNEAYLQVPLDESSKKYGTVNTHKGLLFSNHFPLEVAYAPSIF